MWGCTQTSGMSFSGVLLGELAYCCWGLSLRKCHILLIASLDEVLQA